MKENNEVLTPNSVVQTDAVFEVVKQEGEWVTLKGLYGNTFVVHRARCIPNLIR